MLWFNFILALNFIFFCFKLIINITISKNINQGTKDKMNHNFYNVGQATILFIMISYYCYYYYNYYCVILSSFLVFFEYSQPRLNSFPELRYATLSARYEQYQGYLADNCAVPNMSGRLNLLW